ncbi:MAG TPA: oxidoreductase [Clostridiales bacterium]|jgi:3-oxoacyl-[acyl-carrier protein] reductase|nr:oxidoreductase [Clostridiales bacterium]
MVDYPVTLITGTRKGIGKYLVEHYVKLGHNVVGCSRSAPDWEMDGYKHYLADVSDEKAVINIFSNIRKDYGKLDILINNAGIASMNHAILTPISSVHNVLNTNFVGTFLFCREAAKLMQKYKYGRIVNFSTVAVPLNLAGEAVYAASKAAIVSLTKTLASEFAKWEITVNAVGPTPIETDLIRNVPEQKMNELLRKQAISKMGSFSDVSNVIDFYIKPESSFITGQVIYLGGVF